MERKTFEAQKDDLKFRIKENLSDGKVYLNVLKKNGGLIKEFYENSVGFLKNFALGTYGIPLNSWYEMKVRIFEAQKDDLKLRIEEDYPEVGAYLFVNKGGKDIRDDLQNTIDDCKEIALKMFEIPLDFWHEVDS